MATRDTFLHIKALNGQTTSLGIANIDDIEALENRMDQLESSVEGSSSGSNVQSVTLTGDASGTGTSNDSGNITINTTVTHADEADSASQLTTARTVQVNLESTSAASFNGTANITPGVTGTLPITNGGTGATTAANALNNLGITYGTTDLTAGESALATGAIYLVYE